MNNQLLDLIDFADWAAVQEFLGEQGNGIYDFPEAFFRLLPHWMYDQNPEVGKILFQDRSKAERVFRSALLYVCEPTQRISLFVEMVAAKMEHLFAGHREFVLPMFLLDKEQKILVERVEEAAVKFKRDKLNHPERLDLGEIARQIMNEPLGGRDIFIKAHNNPEMSFHIPVRVLKKTIEGRTILVLNELRNDGSVKGRGGEHYKRAANLVFSAVGFAHLAVRFCQFCHPRSAIGCEFQVPFELFFSKEGFRFNEDGIAHFI